MSPNFPPLYWQENFFAQFSAAPLTVNAYGYLSHWFLEEKTLKSGFSAPFGGFWPVTQDPHKFSIDGHLEIVRSRGDIMGPIEDLKVRLSPDGLFENNFLVTSKVLERLGFDLCFTETDHIIDLDDDWLSNWNRNRKRDLRKSCDFLVFKKVDNRHHFRTIVEIIDSNRSSKGVVNNLNVDTLINWKALFGNDILYYLCTTRETELPVAAAICQTVNKSISYVYKWGDERKTASAALNNSPMSYLAYHLFVELKSIGIERIYLGTSSVNGNIDLGLARFKESIGGKRLRKQVVSQKFTF